MLRKSRLKTFLWYSGAGLLVTVAVAVSLFRVYISSVEEYREQLQTLAGSYLGQPVLIGKMDAKVVGFSPTIVLSDVSLLHKDGKQLLTRFDAIDIALAPIASLRNFDPIIELIVSGANLEITYRRDGTFAVRGLELTADSLAKQSDQSESEGQTLIEGGGALGNWFLSQSRLALRNSNFTLHNETSGERLRFEDVALELSNRASRHRLNASVNLPKEIGRELSLAVDIEGNLLQEKEWSGQFYLKSVALHPQQWLNQLNWQGSSIRRGMLDVELWSSWQGGELMSVTSRLQALGLEVARGEESAYFPLIATDLTLMREAGGWLLDLDRLRLQHEEAEATPMHLTLRYAPERFSIDADRLQLTPLGVLLPYLPQLEQPTRQMVRTMAPEGEISGLHLRRSSDGRLEVQASLGGVSMAPWERVPGVRGLDGRLYFDGEQGALHLTSDEFELSMPRLFRQPLRMERFDAPLALSREGEQWRLYGDTIALANQHVAAVLGLELALQSGESPWLSLYGKFHGNDAQAIPAYLPAGLLKEKTLYWLDNAFQAGSVPQGKLLFHGRIGHFPFAERNGRFEVLFDAREVGLHYQDGWPDLRKLNGEVQFDGLQMRIVADSARLFEGEVERTEVGIENMLSPQLQLDGRVVFPLNDGLRFLRESPLSRNTGTALEGMSGEGRGKLNLHLAIPLSDRVGESKPLQVRGDVLFSDSQIELMKGVQISGLGGTLDFTEKSFSSPRFDGVLYGQPVKIVVSTDSGRRHIVEVTARGRSSVKQLRQAFDLGLLDFFEGQAAWRLKLSLPQSGGGSGVVLALHSDMQGVTSNLPHPLTKASKELQDLALTFYLSGERSTERELTLGNEFGMVWRQDATLRRAQLHLGAQGPLSLPPRDVIQIIGRAEQVPLAAWRNVLRKLTDGGDGKSAGAASRPSVEVKMARLHFAAKGEERGDGKESGSKKTQLEDIPELAFRAEGFGYDDMEFGALSFTLAPQSEQLLITGIMVDSPHMQLKGEGYWNRSNSSYFKLGLDTPDLGEMLQSLGFASVIRGGRGHADGTLWWVGEPGDVELANLNGELAVSIKEGTILDVDPGAGRMLGILSIPALPRRLFLDFSDIFKEGFGFESVKGNLRIEEGHAYTTNLQLASLPAGILITGRTGLATQDLDQQVYVTPNFSDTATVASALAWGPQVGAVVALFQELFKSDIQKSTMIQYNLSGSWQKPNVERVGEDPVSEQQADDEPFFYE
ncbi:MAG: DUF3971 domain-containing protein [Chromatiales bacterium]|nr:DUF3971 domain-containing protein [Chromatiales bacterium]